MPTFVCQYGNCEETDTKITVTDRNGMERARFCCQEHAGLYLLRRAWQYSGRNPPNAERITEAVAANLKN